jgi:hypothetical protein
MVARRRLRPSAYIVTGVVMAVEPVDEIQPDFSPDSFNLNGQLPITSIGAVWFRASIKRAQSVLNRRTPDMADSGNTHIGEAGFFQFDRGGKSQGLD